MLSAMLLAVSLAQPPVDCRTPGYESEARTIAQDVFRRMDPALARALAGQGVKVYLQRESLSENPPLGFESLIASCRKTGGEECKRFLSDLPNRSGLYDSETKTVYATPKRDAKYALAHELGHALEFVIDHESFERIVPEISREMALKDARIPSKPEAYEHFAKWYSCKLYPEQTFCELLPACPSCQVFYEEILRMSRGEKGEHPSSSDNPLSESF